MRNEPCQAAVDGQENILFFFLHCMHSGCLLSNMNNTQNKATGEGKAAHYEIKRMLEPQGTTFGIYKNGKLFEYGFLTEKAAKDWLSIYTGEGKALRMLTDEQLKRVSAEYGNRRIRVAKNGDIEYFAPERGISRAPAWVLAIEADNAWDANGNFVA